MAPNDNQVEIQNLKRSNKTSPMTFENFKKNLSSLTEALRTFEKNELKMRKEFGQLKITEKEILQYKKHSLDERFIIFQKHQDRVKKELKLNLDELQIIEKKHLQERISQNKKFYKNLDINITKINKELKKAAVTSNINDKPSWQNKQVMSADEKRKENQEKSGTIFYRNQVITQNRKTNDLLRQGNDLQASWWKWTKTWELFKSIASFLAPILIAGAVAGLIGAFLLSDKFRGFLIKTIKGIFFPKKDNNGDDKNKPKNPLLAVPRLIPPAATPPKPPEVLSRSSSAVDYTKYDTPSNLRKPGDLQRAAQKPSWQTRATKIGTAADDGSIAVAKNNAEELKQLKDEVIKDVKKLVPKDKSMSGKALRLVKALAKERQAITGFKTAAKALPAVGAILQGVEIGLEVSTQIIEDSAEAGQEKVAKSDYYGNKIKGLDKNKWGKLGLQHKDIRKLDAETSKELSQTKSYIDRQSRLVDLRKKMNDGDIKSQEVKELYALEERVLAQRRRKENEIYLKQLNGDIEKIKEFNRINTEYNELQRKLRQDNKRQQQEDTFERRKAEEDISAPYMNKDYYKDPKARLRAEAHIKDWEERAKKTESEKQREFYEFEIWKLKKKLNSEQNRTNTLTKDEQIKYFEIQKGSTANQPGRVQGLHPNMLGFMEEIGPLYLKEMGKKMPIVSAVRSKAEDERLGTSRNPGYGPHTRGEGLDVGAEAANWVMQNPEAAAIAKKWGIGQPDPSGDPTHLGIKDSKYIAEYQTVTEKIMDNKVANPVVAAITLSGNKTAAAVQGLKMDSKNPQDKLYNLLSQFVSGKESHRLQPAPGTTSSPAPSSPPAPAPTGSTNWKPSIDVFTSDAMLNLKMFSFGAI